jgi:hypothetical protein
LSKFEGKDGRKPSTEARCFVYRVLAKTLVHDLSNDSGWLYEDMDEFDRRRVRNAVQKVIVELKKKGGVNAQEER